tara:strand:- start:279 stop:536 length:258 start_codon:yes stop_codon:yes gene_type:complete
MVKIITLDSLVSDVMDVSTLMPSGWMNSPYNSETRVIDMTLSEFLTKALKVNGFGKTKYRSVIRAAVFSEYIEYDARETILESVL